MDNIKEVLGKVEKELNKIKVEGVIIPEEAFSEILAECEEAMLRAAKCELRLAIGSVANVASMGEDLISKNPLRDNWVSQAFDFIDLVLGHEVVDRINAECNCNVV